MAENEKNLYDILGLSKDASESDIKKAFRKLAAKYHPDKQTDKTDAEKKEAEERFKEINSAYEVLSDPEKKQKYDIFGTVDGHGFNPGGGFGNFGGFSFDINDILSGMGSGFRSYTSAKANHRVRPGQSIEMRVPLTIEEIYSGCTKKLKLRKKKRCPNCHGSKGETEKCSHCGGSGFVRSMRKTAFGTEIQERPCSFCGGTGEKIVNKCKSCDGTGFREVDEIEEVTFPAGINNGAILQKSGAGNESQNIAGPNGDFTVYVYWNIDHNRYEIDGFDVIETIYIPYYDALLGCTYLLTLPNGKQLNVKIPQNTEYGKDMKIPGKGIVGKDPYTGMNKTGDYYINIRYSDVNEMSDRERELLEEIKKLHSSEENIDTTI